MKRQKQWAILILGIVAASGTSQSPSVPSDLFHVKTTVSISDIQKKILEDLANDLPQLEKYRQANAALAAPIPGVPRIIFFGDSLTEGWGWRQKNGSEFFPGKGYINRGISGQTTIQMLARFRQDVIDLHPDVVLFLAGTNDLAGNLGPSSPSMVADNIASMADMARANQIRFVVCSELPTSGYRWRPDVNPVEPIRVLNAWLKRFAQERGIVYVDYYSALADQNGAMKPGMSWDGVHPQAKGYSLMAPLAEAAIQAALKQKP